MEPSRESTMRVRVRTADGDLLVRVSPDETVAELKTRLQARLQPRLGQMRLFYRGQHMEDKSTLRDCAITPDCIIHHVPRIVAGGAEPTPSTLPTARHDDDDLMQAVVGSASAGHDDDDLFYCEGPSAFVPFGSWDANYGSRRRTVPFGSWLRIFRSRRRAGVSGDQGASPAAATTDRPRPPRPRSANSSNDGSDQRTEDSHDDDDDDDDDDDLVFTQGSSLSGNPEPAGVFTPGMCLHCVREPLPEVTPQEFRDFRSGSPRYRAQLPGAGSFQCSVTGLGFEASSAATIRYHYGSWNDHLGASAREEWLVAGPLFSIKAQPGAVRAVRLPHFVCLAEEVDVSECRIAHFKAGSMTLEKPTKLAAFYAVLENPSFSLLGVVWRRLRSTLISLPMHSLVLIFQQLSAANTTLHLYLIPDDNSVKQAIEKQEMDWNSKLIPKPSPLSPLFFGCTYQVSSTSHVEITPEPHLPFCYKSPKEQQLFVEIYIRNMAEEIWLLMTDVRNDTLVWKVSLRSGDCAGVERAQHLASAHAQPPASWSLTGAAFVKKHKTELCFRMGRISPILLHLQDANVINSDEEDEVLSQRTRHKKNKALLQLVERKGCEAQEQLYRILRQMDKFLVSDLEKSS